jgi:hypothetical protein
MPRMNFKAKTVLVRMELPGCMGNLPPSKNPAARFLSDVAGTIMALRIPSIVIAPRL